MKLIEPPDDASEAFDAIGHMSHYELVGLVKALSVTPWRNTPADETKRLAAIWALKNRYAYSRECRLRRDGLTSRKLWTGAQLRAFSE